MVVRAKIDVDELVQEDATEFKVSRRVYTDPEIFDLELEKIFYRTWVYIGHETEIPQGGDYKATYIGRQPIIMARHTDDNQVYVFFNRCRHRGTTVCQQEYGNAAFFRCSYHGWVYNNKGDLIGVPFPEGYGEGFDLNKMGLVQVPRLGNYKGFIFASLSPEGPGLLEHLGNARPYIDKFAAMAPGGIKAGVGFQKSGYQGNWKLQVENTVDGYHFTVLHESYMKIVERRVGQTNYGNARGEVHTWDLGNGHSVLDIEPAGLNASSNRPGYNMVFRHRAGQSGPGFNLWLFPNVALLFSQIRVIRPIAVDRSEVSLYPIALKEAPAEVNEDLIWEHVDFYGPASFASPDDLEVFSRLQAGHQAKENEWVLFSRGLKGEKATVEGSRFSSQRDESSQRAIYRHWKRIMAES